MVCPKCRSEVDNIIITKGSKITGINFFCKKIGCDYEVDRRLRKKPKPLNIS